ncbi:MAG: sugar ABC transporter permease [Chloroflexi bacterium]|nr:sugar ABC transporter permease [Chloroflexota bacterium]
MPDRMAFEVPEKAGTRTLADREGLLGTLFLLPAFVYIITLVGIPLVLAITYSFSNVTAGNTAFDFNGLENFRLILATPQFRRALWDTLYFTIVSQIIIIILATALAELLALDFRGKRLARVLLILPWATPISLGTIGWLWLLDSKFSPIDWVLRAIHLLGPGTIFGPGLHMNYLGKTNLAMASVIIVYVWRFLPLSAVILMAGLTSINREILDQAAVDGSGFWRTLLEIKVPLLLPIVNVALLFGFISMFSDMTVIFLLTRGGPVYYTQVLASWAYFKGVEGGALGEGAATALFLFPVLLAGVIMVLRSTRRMEVT